MKLKVTSDGTRAGTKVTNLETGEELEDVSEVRFGTYDGVPACGCTVTLRGVEFVLESDFIKKLDFDDAIRRGLEPRHPDTETPPPDPEATGPYLPDVDDEEDASARFHTPSLEPPADLDLDARCVVGEAIAPGVPNTELKPGGQQKGYSVLCEEERAKGFVRPVRRSYKHLKCGAVTTMSTAIAETYARFPQYYSGTFCSTCSGHFPVGKDGEFVWLDAPTEKVGT